MINVTKAFLLIAAFSLLNIRLLSQNTPEYNVCVFMDINFKGVKTLFEYPQGRSIMELKHNFIDENYICFTILNKNDSMFYVSVFHSIDGQSFAKGWIMKDKCIGIYTRAYEIPLKLYKYPNDSASLNHILKEYNPEMYIVTDCKGKWLKVETIIKGRKICGWLSPEMQCCNVYSSCN